MLFNLIRRFWSDEAGAVIATEYLMLGSIVAVGSAAGMAEMRDAMTDEYKEFGNSIREVRQQYSVPAMQGGSGSRGGTTVTNPRAAAAQQAPRPDQGYTFSDPIYVTP